MNRYNPCAKRRKVLDDPLVLKVLCSSEEIVTLEIEKRGFNNEYTMDMIQNDSGSTVQLYRVTQTGFTKTI
jgi:hypothetical protein